MKVVKRDGRVVDFDEDKIVVAISKANKEVPENERMSEAEIYRVISKILCFNKDNLSVEEIQDFIEKEISDCGHFSLAKRYIIYRYTRALLRQQNTTDKSILDFIRGKNELESRENSNKNTTVAGVQRDIIAGITSRDLTVRVLLPKHIAKAHEDGLIHFHDSDYFIQNIPNCCLINIKDMLDNGTVINGLQIETPKSFRVACTVVSQIIAQVASGQYGGQSVNVKHLGKYLKVSENKYKRIIRKYLTDEDLTDTDKEFLGKENIKDLKSLRKELSKKTVEKLINVLSGVFLNRELSDGIQTVQYQLNTLITTNGGLRLVISA